MCTAREHAAPRLHAGKESLLAAPEGASLPDGWQKGWGVLVLLHHACVNVLLSQHGISITVEPRQNVVSIDVVSRQYVVSVDCQVSLSRE